MAIAVCLMVAGAARSQSTIDLAGAERRNTDSVIVLPGLSGGASAGSLPGSGLSFRRVETESTAQLLAASLEPGTGQQKGLLLPSLTIYSRTRVRSARVGTTPIGFGGMSVHAANFDAGPGEETVVGIYRDSGNGEVQVELPATIASVGSGKKKPAATTLLRIRTQSDRSGLGRAIASGDINGDGHRDLILGASTEGLSDRPFCGLIYVVFGPLSGLGSELILDPDSEQNQYAVIYGEGENFYCGFSVASGDVNGDGLDDVVIGAPEAVHPYDEGSRSGRVYLVHGSDDFPSSVDLYTNDEKFGGSPSTPVFSWYSSSNVQTQQFLWHIFPRLGFSVDCGNVNGDEYDDILIGSPGANLVEFNKPQAGQCYLLFGNSNFATYTPPAGDLEELLETSQVARFGHRQAGAMLGNAVALGDLNGDGNDDVVLGAWRTDALGREDAGCVYVSQGGDHLRGAITELTPEGPQPNIIGGRTGDYFGSNIAADDDFDGDGIADLAVSAYGFGQAANTKTGAVYIFRGILPPAPPAGVLPVKIPKKASEGTSQEPQRAIKGKNPS